MNRSRIFIATLGMAAVLGLTVVPAFAFITFESGQVRPLAKSPDGTLLFVCNTPDNHLEIFDISGGGMTHVSSVAVGLEPVAVAARTNNEIWVVNLLSDSVSILDISDSSAPRITRSLNVGDEPRDIVFGGTSFDHAYITTAHRGQNIGFDPQLTTPSVGRADVWVFNANNLGSHFGGDAEDVLTLFGDTPRPLAVSTDGSRVYAGVFYSGNQTTVLGEGMVPDAPQASGGLPNPKTNYAGVTAPEVGLIVKYNGSHWVDELGRDWSSKVKFNLPDFDVFVIDATQNPPVQVAGSAGRFAHVGTTLFNMSVNPADGKIFVTNLEAFNDVRFEGPGTFAGHTVRGHIAESRITVIDPVAETVTPRHLNKHINYDQIFDPTPNATNDKSLAFPLETTFDAAGTKMYVAALGSSKVGVFTPSQIEDDSFVPDSANHIELSGGGPTGLVLDEAGGRLFVLTRFDNSVSVVNTALNTESSHVALHNPEPASVVEGRPFLYDARYTSARGDQACASCHIFGDLDHLAWDLGNPDDDRLHNPSPLIIGALTPPVMDPANFHPMKGPMTTQSLRGMDNQGPMHWRGDRTGGNDITPLGSDSQPNRGIYNEDAAFKKFNIAFPGLIGRSSTLPDDEMQKYTDFILQVMYPPNPNRNLDDSLRTDQTSASSIYFNRTTDTLQKCNGCHVHDRSGNAAFATVKRPGFFGTDGRSTFENETQIFKVAQLRNLYQKVGMFGNATEPFINPGDNGNKGDQVRGFGFLHDGSIDTVFRFFHATVFNSGTPLGLPNDGLHNDTERRQMEDLMLSFDSNLRPIVGQQSTLSDHSGGDADNRIDLLLARADAGDCEVVVKGKVGGEERGWVYAGSGQFTSDRASEADVADGTLRAYAKIADQELTYTAVPVGEGERIGIDRDLDGYRDAEETDNGGDPADAFSLPCMTSTSSFVFKKASLMDSRGRLQVSGDITLASTFTADSSVAVRAQDGNGMIVSAVVPAGSFSAIGGQASYKYKAPKGSHGVTGVSVKSLTTPGLYRVTVKTDAGWTASAADETTATTSVTLQVTDECFEGAAIKVY